MNVLYYHQYFKTRQGIGGTRSYEFAVRLVNSGHKVTMVCAQNPKSNLNLSWNKHRGYSVGVIDGIKIIQINIKTSERRNYFSRAMAFLLFSIKTIKFAFSEDYDVLFATSTPITIGIPGIMMKIFKQRKKFVFEVRDLWPELPREMGIIKNRLLLYLLDILEWSCYKSADACIGLSPGIVRGISRRGVDIKKIALIPNSCDLDLFIPGIGDKHIIPGCDNNSFISIFTGRHGVANGLDYVIRVAECLQLKNESSIKLVLIGDGEEKNRLINLVRINKLINCIFIDPVSKESLVKYLQVSDVGMMILENVPAFSYGTSPNKFFDYISTGLPVVVNHYGWVADLITEYQCGLVADPLFPEQYANKLVELKNNRDIVIRMGKNARTLAETQFSREKLSMQFESFLKEQTM